MPNGLDEHDIEIEGNGPCSEPEPPDDCEDDDDECCEDENSSSEPVQYFSGRIQLTETDLTARIPGLTHRRMFRNRNYKLDNWDSAQGWNWAISEWPYLVRRTKGEKETIILKRGQHPVFFDATGSGQFVARYGAGSRHALVHDSSEGLLIYTKQTSRGLEVIEFQDFDQPPSRFGLMKRRVSNRGYEFVVTGYGDGTVLGIESERDETTCGLDYSFHSSGDHVGKLEHVTLYQRETRGGSRTDIRRVRYSYYDGSTIEGSLNDLKAAITQRPEGQNWIDVEVRYYRYYKEGDPNGFAHGLRYVVSPATYADLLADGQDPLTMLTDGDGKDLVKDQADHYFQYDDAHRVIREVARGCAGCGSGGAGTGSSGKRFERTKNPDYPIDSSSADDDIAFNTWMWKIIERNGDDYETIIFTNRLGQVMLKAIHEVNDHARQWIIYNRYSDDGKKIWTATPSAVTGFDETQPDLVCEQSGGNFVYLRHDNGLIRGTTYYNSTTATDTTSGGVAGRVEYTWIRQGTAGAEIKLTATTYIASGSGDDAVYMVAESTRYASETDQEASKITTSFDYQWHADPPRIKERITNLPTISIEQNGDGSPCSTRDFYDKDGNLLWHMDERGVVTAHEYDRARGLRVRTVQDSDSAQMPSGWSALPGSHFNTTTDYEYDELGRQVLSMGPQHEAIVDEQAETVRRATFTLYNESTVQDQSLGDPPICDQKWSGKGYAIENQAAPGGYDYGLINPVNITFTDKAGRVQDQIVSARSSGSGRLMPTDTFLREDWARWSTMHYNDRGQIDYQRDYHLIPPSSTGLDGIHQDLGLPGTNYYETFYGYAHKSNLLLRQKSPDGTITRTVFDAIRREKATYVGTNDVPDGEDNSWEDWYPGAPGTDLVIVSEQEYDGGNAGGLSNVTRVSAFVDATEARQTSYEFDYRGRQVVEDGEETQYRENVYDNLDHVTESRSRNTSASGNLIGLTETRFDDRGRVYETRLYGVDPATGDPGVALTGENYYDAAGNLIESIEPGDGTRRSWTTFDNLGRATVRKVGYLSPAQVPALPVFVESSESEYDDASNLLQTASKQMDAGASPTSPTYRISYTQYWYDSAGRMLATADLGAIDPAPVRPALPPARSDTVLVTTLEYNEAGEQESVTDPSGKIVRQEFDNLGRQTKLIENWVDPGTPSSPEPDYNRTTETIYAPNGQVATLTAVMADPQDNQVTTYTYGTSLSNSAIASNQLLREIAYPDSQNGSDVVKMSYNRQQQVVKRVDQAGTTHEYVYDGLSRLLHDRVTNFGPRIQQTVKRISTQYDVRGMPSLITSHLTADVTRTAVVNQVRLEYNDFGQLIKDHQSHHGKVDDSTPVVEYAFTDGSGNRSRPTRIIYPSSRHITFGYGSSSQANNFLNRVQSVTDVDDTTLASYTYLGQRHTVRTVFPEPSISLDLWGGTAGQYTGFDRFGRTTNTLWEWQGLSTSQMRAHLHYGYDRSSNRLWREDLAAAAAPGSPDFDELYAYDQLNRLIDMHRGRLNSAKDGIESGKLRFQQQWMLDPLGNWDQFNQDDNGEGWDLKQQRQHNRVNEITAISASEGPAWLNPEYDAAGNTRHIPNPKVTDKYFKATYDAWNRLVRVIDGKRLAEYEYDGRGFCTRRRAYDGEDNLTATFDDYYTNDWRLIETRVTHAGTTTAHLHEQYVWSHSADAYVDSLILRDRDSNGNGQLNERLYVLQDANYNVIGVADPAQSESPVVERYAYSAYGQRMILADDFTERVASVFEWIVGHQGLRHEVAIGLIRNRHRELQPALGRWLTRDPLGYVDGMDLYEYVRSDPRSLTDSQGLRAITTQFGAFIPGRLGIWLPEPFPFSNWFFKTDNRGFGGGTYRIYAYGWVESTQIGKIDRSNSNAWVAAGPSLRRRGTPSGWEYESAYAKVFGGARSKNTGPCSTMIVFHGSAGYPFAPGAVGQALGAIDFQWTVEFTVVEKDLVGISYWGWHDGFPDYEGFLDNTLRYTYQTPFTGPTVGNLGPGSNVTIPGQGFWITAETPESCPCP